MQGIQLGTAVSHDETLHNYSHKSNLSLDCDLKAFHLGSVQSTRHKNQLWLCLHDPSHCCCAYICKITSCAKDIHQWFIGIKSSQRKWWILYRWSIYRENIKHLSKLI